MRRLTPFLPWPFEGRIWHRRDAEGRSLVILRGDAQGVTLLIDHLTGMRDGMLQLLFGEPIDGQFVLGSGHAPSFEFGPGLPLFDYLVRDIPADAFKRNSRAPAAFLYDDLIAMKRRLVDDARQGAAKIISKPWPLAPETKYTAMRVDDLGLWRFETATCFAQFGNSEHRRCDVRVVETGKPRTSTDRRSIPELMAAAYRASGSPPDWTAMQAMLNAQKRFPDAPAWQRAGKTKRSAERYWQKAQESLD